MSRGLRPLLAVCACLAWPGLSLAALVNPAFDQGLSGWTVTEDGGTSAPGDVAAIGGAALLSEGDSFRVTLEQAFALPLRPDILTFSLDEIPGFDQDTSFLPDAFEARLLDPQGRTVVPPWTLGSTAFFNLQEDGTFHAAAGVRFDGTFVTVDVSDLASGRSVVLSFDLIGGDAGTASGVTLDDIDLGSINGAPVAVAGSDDTVECDALPVTLDGSASLDPDLDPLTYVWLDESDAVEGAGPTVEVSPPIGESTWTLRVSDPLGATSADEVILTVVDTKGPAITRPSGPLSVDVDGTCRGLLPDVVVLSTALDACGGASLVQDPPAGSSFAAGALIAVRLTATDDAGNTTRRSVDVEFLDPSGTCVIIDTGGSGPGGPGGVDTSDTSDTDQADTDLSTDTDDTDAPADTDLGDTDGSADTDAPTDTDGPADTDAPADTDTEPDTDAAPTDDNVTDDFGGEVTDDSTDKSRPSCGCASTDGVGSGAPLLVLAVVSLAARRRGAVSRGLRALCAALVGSLLVSAPAHASDPVTLALGATTAGEVATAGEVDTYTFTATAGQAVFVDAFSTSNFWNMTWLLRDHLGRVLVRGNQFADLGRVRLMGGTYFVDVSCVGSAVGTYTFAVHDSPDLDDGLFTLDTEVRGAISHPGERHAHHVQVPAHARVFVDVIEASNFWSTGWRLTDDQGLVVAEQGYSSDPGLLALRGGDYTFTVFGSGEGVGTYGFRFDTVQDDTGVLAVGTTVSGTLAGPGDSDTWTFPATAGQRLALVFSAVTNYWDNSWQVLDPAGAVVASNGYMADRAPLALGTGTYSLVVKNNRDGTGAYSVRLGPITDVSSSATIGSPVVSTFAEAGQVATYSFVASAGDTVALRYLSSTGMGTYDVGFTVRDAAGLAVWGPTTHMAWPGTVALAGGAYTITIDPANSAVGTVTWSLLHAVTQTSALTLGSTVTSEFSAPAETDVYTFTAPANSLLDLRYVSSTAPYNVHYRLRDAVGREVLARTGEMFDRLGIALAGGSYTLELVSDADLAPAYAFTAILNGAPTFTPSGTPITLDTLVSGTIAAAGTVVDYRINLASPRDLYFDLISGSADLVWTLFDPAGRIVFGPVEARDTFWQDQGVFNLAAGSYTLRVTSPTGTPSYSFCAVDVPAMGSAVVALGDSTPGQITVPGARQAFTFTLADTTRVYLDLTTAGAWLNWSLKDEVGRVLLNATADNTYWSDQGPLALRPGTYTLVFDATNDQIPLYGFTLRAATDTVTTIALDELVTGSFAAAGDTRTYSLVVPTRTRVHLDWTVANNGEDVWTLTDPNGMVRGGPSAVTDPYWHDVGPLELTAGTWSLKLDPTQDAVPNFGFQFATVRDGASVVALDGTANGSIDGPGETDRWTLHLNRPTRVYFDDLASTQSMVWGASDSEGRALFADVDGNDLHGSDRGPYDLGAGDYTVQVRVRGGGTQSYSFSPRSVVDTTTQVQIGDTVSASTPSPGVTSTWRFDAAEAQLVILDALAGGYPTSLELRDPVGQLVFPSGWLDTNGSDWAGALAAGTYSVVVRSAFDYLYAYKFELRTSAPEDSSFYYTRYAGGQSLKRASYVYDGVFRLGVVDTIASISGADGLLVAPDGDLMIGAGANVFKVNPLTGTYTSVTLGGGEAEHLSLDPSGTILWTSAQPGALVEVPLVPFGNGTVRTLRGDDLGVTHIAFDRRGRAFYAASGGAGNGSFGVIDMSTFTTTRVFANLPAAHGIAFDPFTETLVLVGADHITQIDPATFAIVSDRQVPGMIFDQGSVDGAGHAFTASNTGDFVFIDYAESGRVNDPAAYTYARFLDSALDDVAPLSWLGSGCFSAPPIVSVSPAQGSAFPPGTVVAISGRATPLDPTRPVVAVLIDGLPVDTIDASGRFFATRTIGAGEVAFHIEAFDRCNESRYTLALRGDAAAGVGAAELIDITASMKADFTDTTFGTDVSRLLVDVRGQNIGDQPVIAPILLGIGGDLHPTIRLENPDGTTVDGLPYVRLAETGALASQGLTAKRTLSFLDPERRPVRFTPRWYTLGNHAPYFTTVPGTEASVGKAWRYDADATDPDGQAVTFAVERGPVGLTVSAGSGVATWTPVGTLAGLHEVVLVARDGFGGESRQTFSIAVAPTAANTPPVFSTSPGAHVSVGASYLYDANAFDRDGDALSFALDDAPSGVTVDAGTGEVTWLFPLPGTHPLSLKVLDGHGGEAWQGWTLTVGEVSTNPNGPRITSSPPLVAVVANLYFYQPVAFDPDGDTLSWTLLAGPEGMTADPTTGRVLWSPTEGQAGSATATLSVSDGFGGEARQTWSPVVVNGVPNRPPVFSTSPPSVAVVGVPFVYDADAVDPEVSDITYGKAAGPASVSVQASTGLLSWTPGATDVGLATLGVSATDDAGLAAAQVFYVVVRDGNRAPQILSAPPSTDAYVGDLWQHDVNAYDADGDALRYTLSDGPPGMTLDPGNGLVSYAPEIADLGAHAFTVTVSDPFGGSVVAHYAVQVVMDVTPPIVVVSNTPDVGCLDVPMTVCVGASDDVAVSTRSLKVAGVATALDARGCVDLSRSAPVSLSVTATATDGSGNSASDTRAIAFTDCNNTNAPVVTILEPTPGALVEGPFDVVATITDDQPAGLTWTLEVSPHGADEWTPVDSGAGEVSAAVLGTIDTTLLPNGDYDLRVVADDGPNFNDTRQTVAVGGDMKLGNFQISFTDLSVDLHGISLSITRSYDSLSVGSVGDFGAGWRLGLSGKVWDTPLEAAEGTDPLVAMFSTASLATGDHVWVERPDGRRVGFTFEPGPAGVLAPFVGSPTFTPDPGVTDTLAAVGPATIFNYGNGWRDFILSYNPSVYVLTTAQGMTYTLDEVAGLQKAEDPYGNVVEVRADGLFHSDGVAVTFTRDALGRITRITEPTPLTGAAGLLDYGYDADGNLAWSEDQLDLRTAYTYDAPGHPHHLTQIADPLGRPVVRTVYDADGRLTAQCGPEGDVTTLVGCTSFEHLPFAGSSTVVDAAGHRTDLFYDDRGNVILERRHLDGGLTQDVETTFDADGSPVSVTTDGKTWRFSYDALSRMTRAERPGGQVTTWVYGRCPTFDAQVGAGGDTWTVEHDASCHESAVVGPTGDRTVYHWDRWGDLVGVDEPVGGSWTFERDSGGRPTRTVDPRGAVTLQTWTSTGEMTSRTEPDGRTITFVYDAAKRVVSESWSAPGARSVVYAWDDADRLRTATDPDAVVTLTYDAIGRLGAVDTAPTGGPRSVVSYAYDANGRVAEVSDDRTGRTTYAWDALGRVTSMVQTATGTTSKRVDTTWDALSRPTRITRSVDVLGAAPRLRTELGYGDDGVLAQLADVRQVRVSDDAVLDGWSVSRDARSLVEAFTDDEGVHARTLDGEERVLAVDHPTGSALPDEHYRWDAAANRVSSHLSASYVHGYDAHAGGEELVSDDTYTYAWDANGRMTRRTRRSDGEHADLIWDHRGRLVSVTVRSAAGAVQSSTQSVYDALDRRIHVTTAGVSSWSVYDGMNPIVELDDAGTTRARRLYGRGMDDLVAEEVGGSVRWLTRDVAGNIRDVLQTDGTRLARVRYDSFGRVVSGALPAGSALGFQARPSDTATGFVDFRARTYDPQTGRFLSPDPRRPYGYEYAQGNPVDYHDPTGRSIAVEYACLSSNAVAAANDFNDTIAAGTGDLLNSVASAVATLTAPSGNPAAAAAGSVGWYLSSLMGGPSGPGMDDAIDAVRQKGEAILCGMNGAEADVANQSARNIAARAPNYPLGWSHGFYTITP